jgi:cysteine-rich repeat protein
MPPGAPFTFGETEDRFVGGVYPGTAGPGGGPLPGPAGGGFPGGIGGGAFGKGVLNPAANPAGACLMDIDCGPEDLVVPCGKTGTVFCKVTFKSGNCPELAGQAGCNVQVDAQFVKHLGVPGGLAKVSPVPQCGWVGPGARELIFSFDVTFPPPCVPPDPNPRKQRWKFVALHDPDGVYGEVGADEHQGTVITLAPPGCGNMIPEPPLESCDDGNLFYGDACSGDCKFPGYVPNGFLGTGEQCDDGNVISGDGCNMFGLREYCGNLAVNPHEECDDGNQADGDGCTRHCQFESPGTCPNFVVDHVLEQCDDGNLVDGDGCDENCQLELCGDGSIDLGEQCDDGNAADNDGCDSSCASEGACGNGWIDVGEQCDDGNLLDGDGCSPSCQRVAIHVEGLTFEQPGVLAWDAAVAPLRSYDVLRGDLGALHAAGGDHAAAGAACLARAVRTESLADASSPASGAAFYYLLRVALPWAPVQATYDPAPPADGYAGGRDAATACD